MKKISLFLSLFLAFAGATKAQNSKEPKGLLVKDAVEELIDGTVIALQCRDYSAGADYYFNGDDYKTATFSANNLFVVEGNAADGMKLRRFNGFKYIGKNNNNKVIEVESATDENVVTFTAKSYKNGNGFTLTTPAAEMDGTERDFYVRFFIGIGKYSLNMQDRNTKPIYHNGEGGYSMWYVYKFPEYKLNIEQVSQASLSFNRTSETTSDIIVNISGSDEGEGGNGSEHTATADFGLTISNKNEPTLSNTDKFPNTLLCPNVNIGNEKNADQTQVSAQLTFTLNNLPEDFSFSRALLEIHALNSTCDYHSVARYCNITLSCGEEEDKVEWPTLENQNITKDKGILLTLTGESIKAKEDGTLVLTLNITKGSSNKDQGLFVGLSGITLIKEKRSEDKKVSSETVKEMKIADVEDLLKVIEAGYEKLNGDIESDNEDLKYKFPVQADDVTNVVWPQALNGVFTGLDDNNFELLTHAQKAIEDAKNENTDNTENLDAAKQNLADFIRICKLDNNNYPVSVVYEAAARYGTLYTPFAATLPDGLTLRECTGCKNNVLTLSEEGSDAVANTAYIVEAENGAVGKKTVQLIGFYNLNEQANSSSLLKGTHTGMTAPNGSYVLQDQPVHGLGFYLVEWENEENEEDKIEVPAGKCYLMLPEPEEDDEDENENGTEAVKYLLFPDGTLTAIDGVDTAKPANAATYDLSGRRVGTMTKGLYIVDGRKVLVK